jgi:hypothetical protein
MAESPGGIEQHAGAIPLGGGLRLIGHSHLGQKAIAAPGHCRNEPGRLRRIAQSTAQLAHGDAHYRIADRRLGPDDVLQGVFGHQSVGMGDPGSATYRRLWVSG